MEEAYLRRINTIGRRNEGNIKQKLRLSSIFSNEYNYKPVLKKLRDDTDQYFAQWQYAPKLREELVLLLDENLCAELNKLIYHY